MQGVGFRPFIYKEAISKHLSGTVCNSADGLHVFFNCQKKSDAQDFSEKIINNSPALSIITSWSMRQIPPKSFSGFSIVLDDHNDKADLLLSPDFAICSACRNEFHSQSNRRFQYPFITCTLCGPRYSIMQRMPYDRHLTTMTQFVQCETCHREYNDVNDRRYFSQTNSCSRCGVRMQLHLKEKNLIIDDADKILTVIKEQFQQGKIIAVKGIGGFLLMCDAGNAEAVATLRKRKHRPAKPFAVLFPDLNFANDYSKIGEKEIQILGNEISPVVVAETNEACYEHLDMEGIAPGLSSIGIIVPYAPLLEWIMTAWKKPLVATSGNLSGSSIIFQSGSMDSLFQFADSILDHNREIAIPADDSVVRFTNAQERIILRRARGMAPSIVTNLPLNNQTILATGAMMKSSFAILHNRQVYVSQYLGSLESYDAQQNFLFSLEHFKNMLGATPSIVLADMHPAYPSTQIAGNYAMELNIPLFKIQHHEAHFAAILAEHHLFSSEEKILGVIWDGTGYGKDGNIWGGEFFMFQDGKIQRTHFLEPFLNISGDKMANEPRLSALAITAKIAGAEQILKNKFHKNEWDYFRKAVNQPALENTSAGRYFDAVSSLLGFKDVNTYEGEAAMKLEQYARFYLNHYQPGLNKHYFGNQFESSKILMQPIFENIITDIQSGKEKEEIAWLFHASMAAIIAEVARQSGIKKIAFSGGVFQNALLIDLVYLQLAKKNQIYIHRQLPPNDECISFGQIMHHQFIKNN